jgi:hypothetical protein
MSSNNFEKQVQRNLEELQFAPSEGVWQNVEKELRKEKKRRRWFLLPLLLLFVAGAGYFIYNSAAGSNVHTVQKNTPVSAPVKAGLEEPIAKDNTVTVPGEKNSTVVEEKKTVNAIPHQTVASKNNTSVATAPLISLTNTKTDKTIDVSNLKNKNIQNLVSIDRKNYHKLDGTDSKTSEKPVQRKENMKPKKINTKGFVVDAGKNKSDEINSVIDERALPEEKKQAAADADKMADVNDAVVKNGVVKKENKIDTARAAPVIASKPVSKDSKKSKWRWYGDVVVGVSNLNTSFAPLGALGISTENKQADALFISSSGRSPGQSLQAFTKPGFSFRAGLAAERKISKRSNVSIGLQYAYYSNLGVAGAVSDTAIINAGLQNLNIASSRGVYISGPVSNNGNQYHFLSIPVSFNTQIGNSKRLPWFWNTGLSFNYLFASNAVVYNSTAKVYNKNNSLFRPLQLGWHTGFEAELFSKKKYPLRLGPQFNFNLSKMLQNPDGQNQRFTYAGIKASISLNRK